MPSLTEIRPQDHLLTYKEWLDARVDDETFAYNTVRQKKYAADEFAAYLQYEDEALDLTDFYGSIDVIKAFFEQTPITKNKVAGVRSFLAYIGRQLSTEEAERLDDVRDRVKRSKLEGHGQSRKGRAKEIEDKILTEDELEAVLAVANEFETLLVRCMLDTGCRPGELAALSPGDFRFDVPNEGIGATVKIDKTYAQGVGVQDHPKSADSLRTVNLRPDTAAMLQEYVAEHDVAESSLIFQDYRTVYDSVKDVFSFAHIKMDDAVTKFSPHWLRHNTATRLIREGYPKEKVQQYMGHSSVTITEIYEHFNEDEVLDIYA